MGGWPVSPTTWSENPYRPEWFDEDFFFCADGKPTHFHPKLRAGRFPAHHCKRTFEVSKPFILSSRNAIDIGCRDGEYTRYLMRWFTHVYCFDPRIRRAFPYNVDLKRTTHFVCALGDTTGRITMYKGTHTPRPNIDIKPYTTPCYPLDLFDLQDIDYIKIDVEGFERRVLVGGEQTILRWKPIIVLEQNAVAETLGEEPRGAMNWLTRRGYCNEAICGENYVMVYRG